MLSKISDYLSQLPQERDPVLHEMEARAVEQDFPIVGPLVGALLFQLARISNAKNILELGSGFGYSAFWFSKAIGDEGSILLTDSDSNNRNLALEYFIRADLFTTFDYRIGDALEIAAKLEGSYDIIFNDIDKEAYPDTIEHAARLLKPGGIFITDNLLWSGQVFEPNPDETTRAIIKFNKQLSSDSRFMTSIMPIRDGVGIAVKL